MARWSIDRAGDEDGGTRHLFSGSTTLSSITAVLDYCCAWWMCAWVSYSGCPSSYVLHCETAHAFLSPDLTSSLKHWWDTQLRNNCHTKSWQWRTREYVLFFGLKRRKLKTHTSPPPMLQLCIISSYFILLQSLYVRQYRSVWSVSAFVCVGGLYPKSMDYTVPCTSMSHSTLTSLPPIWRLPRDSQTEGRVRATGHRVNKCFPQTTFQCSLEHENTDKTNSQSLPCSHHYRLLLYSVLMSCCFAVLLRQLHFSW